MSYTAWAICLVGLRVNQGKLRGLLYNQRQDRSCTCLNFPNSKYCPECGKPVWRTIYTPIEGYDEGNDRLFGFQLEWLGTERPAYISALTAEVGVGGANMLEIDELNLVETAQRMQEKFEPFGLWDAKAFGVHLFLSDDL